MGEKREAAVVLREIVESDLDVLFELMRDPEAVRMAAFVFRDPDDRAAFDAHMAKILSAPEITNRAIVCDGQVVGSCASFVMEGEREVTYWIDRAWWGRNVASRALAQLLELVPDRPISARAASDNAGSLRVLQKTGFEVIGTETAYAPARGTEIEETILRLS